jgi:hypothetical protein
MTDIKTIEREREQEKKERRAKVRAMMEMLDANRAIHPSMEDDIYKLRELFDDEPGPRQLQLLQEMTWSVESNLDHYLLDIYRVINGYHQGLLHHPVTFIELLMVYVKEKNRINYWQCKKEFNDYLKKNNNDNREKMQVLRPDEATG